MPTVAPVFVVSLSCQSSFKCLIGPSFSGQRLRTNIIKLSARPDSLSASILVSAIADAGLPAAGTHPTAAEHRTSAHAPIGGLAHQHLGHTPSQSRTTSLPTPAVQHIRSSTPGRNPSAAAVHSASIIIADAQWPDPAAIQAPGRA